MNKLTEKLMERQAVHDPDHLLTLPYYALAMAGEAGEFCNVVKKLERERLGLSGKRADPADLAGELADVVTYAALCALEAGIDLFGQAVPDKFDEVSDRLGLDVKWGDR